MHRYFVPDHLKFRTISNELSICITWRQPPFHILSYSLHRRRHILYMPHGFFHERDMPPHNLCRRLCKFSNSPSSTLTLKRPTGSSCCKPHTYPVRYWHNLSKTGRRNYPSSAEYKVLLYLNSYIQN